MGRGGLSADRPRLKKMRRKPTKETLLERKSKEVKPWLAENLSKMVGLRSLDEFLWSPSALYSRWCKQKETSVVQDEKEFRLAFISWIHEWIREHRSQIIQAWNEKLKSVTAEAQWELVARHYRNRQKKEGKEQI